MSVLASDPPAPATRTDIRNRVHLLTLLEEEFRRREDATLVITCIPAVEDMIVEYCERLGIDSDLALAGEVTWEELLAGAA